MERHIERILWFSILFGSTVAPPPSKQFRTDYEYNRKTNAFYKMHTETLYPYRAKQVCEMEGAHLMTPTSQEDLAQVHGMFKRYPDLGNYVWVGDDGQKHESAEETPIINLQPESLENAPTSFQGDVLTRTGEIETSTVFRSLPFVCKVNAKDAAFDTQCGVYGTGYQYSPTAHSCYKVPQIAYDWDQAYGECQAEGAHLVVLNSNVEAQAVWEILRTAPRLANAMTTYFFFAGMRANKPTDGSARVFRTIFNETLEEAGYNEWSDGEPNNSRDSEYCGSIFSSNGKFNDVDCTHQYGFICEKEVHS